jgi:hypothetical protein
LVFGSCFTDAQLQIANVVDNTANRGALSTIGFQNGVFMGQKAMTAPRHAPSILLLLVSNPAPKVLLLAHPIRLDQPRPKLIIDLD